MRICRELSNLLLVVFAVLCMTSQAFSARKISFQAKIVKPDGTYLTASAVSFKFTLTDPSGNCILYSEIFNSVDMSTTEGSVLFLLGEGTRSYPTSGGMNWATAFDNKVANYTCGPPSVSTYTQVAGDSRKLYVQFNDGSSSGAQLLPAMDIGAIPYAMYSDSSSTLDAHPLTDFVLKTDVSTCGGAQVLTYNGTSFSCVASGGSGSGGVSGYNFVNTSTNSNTNITAQPSGTATSSGLAVYNSSDAVNNAYGSIISSPIAVDIRSGVNGTGVQLPLTFTIGSSEAMRFDTSGNMGIGTTSPSSKLDLSGALTLRGMAAPALSAAGQGRIYFDSAANKFKASENGGAYADLVGGGASGYANGGNSFGGAATLGTNDNYNLGFKTNNTTKMTIDTTGNVGIGTASPSAKLDINGGGVSVQDAGGMAIALIESSTTGTNYGVYSTAQGIAATNNIGGFFVATGATNNYAIRVGAGVPLAPSNWSIYSGSPAQSYFAGNVGIGVATPGSALDVKGTMRLSGGTSGYVGFAPAAVAGSTTYTWPAADGTGSQVLSTNGSGVLSWASVPSSTLASGSIFVGNASNVATGVPLSGDATLDNTGAMTLATVPVTKGGTAVTSFTANKIVGTNGTGTALTSFGCAQNEVITFNVTGVAVCSTVVAISSAFVNGGNSFGGTATLGTNDNYSLGFKTNNSTKMTIDTSGYVGIGLINMSFPFMVGDGVANDGGIIAKGYGTVGVNGLALTEAGAGTRLIWYPKKAAFRAGRVGSTQWDDANIGLDSAALGRDNQASGQYSLAQGYGNTASGYASFAQGSGAAATGSGSVAMGNNASSSGTSSVAIGSDTIASATGAVALGVANSTASGYGSVALGNAVTASNFAATAIGYLTTASGQYSVALGNQTNATADYSTALGSSTTASGLYATALGSSTSASGRYSIAANLNSTAGSYGQTTLGRYNLPTGAESATSWVATDPLFVVGNGSGSGASRSNALMILKNGNVGIGAVVPQTTLQVDGVISPAANNTYTLGNASYRFTEVYATNGVINTSDRREKKDIHDIDLGLNFIRQLRPVSYRWNTGVDADVHYGLIAQETEEVIAKTGQKLQTSIVTHDEVTDRYGVRYSELIAPLIRAVQQLYKKMTDLEFEMDLFKSQKKIVNRHVDSIDSKILLLEEDNRAKDLQIQKLMQENAEIKQRLDRIEKSFQK